MDEAQEVAVTPAPEQIDTASTESEVKAPEQTTEEQKAEEKAKTFTQEELDAAIGKRLAREQRKWERQQAVQSTAQNKPEPVKLDISKFQTVEEYDAALQSLVESKAEEMLRSREVNQQRTEMQQSFGDKEDAAYEKYEDYHQVAYSQNHQVTEIMAEAIALSDNGPDLAYYLGLHPAESNKIARLSPVLQAKEMGRLEAKLASEPLKPNKTTSAPAPIAPVRAKGSDTSYDTTDPRSTKTMSTSEWIAAENKREAAKLKARYR